MNKGSSTYRQTKKKKNPLLKKTVTVLKKKEFITIHSRIALLPGFLELQMERFDFDNKGLGIWMAFVRGERSALWIVIRVDRF